MRDGLAAKLNGLISLILIATLSLLPLIFVPIFSEYYDMPKIIILVSLCLVLIILWALSWVVQGKVLLTRTPLDLPMLVFLMVVIASAFFSPIRYSSIFGSLPKVHGSGISLVCYIVLYFIATSHLKTRSQIKSLLIGLLISGGLVAIISLLSFFNIYLPLAFARFANFTTTGSSFSVTGFLSMLLPIPLVFLAGSNKLLSRGALIMTTVLFGLTIALVGSMPSAVASLVLVILVLYINRKELIKKTLPFVLMPIIIVGITWGLSYIPSSDSFQNPLFEKRLGFVKFREIQLPLTTSWKIAVSSFRDRPFLGSGPSTFIYDFSQYKPLEYNNTTFWNLRFDAAFNEYLQTLATLGGLGLLALIFITAVILMLVWKSLLSGDQLTQALSISVLIGVVLLLFHVSSVVTMIGFIAILAMFMASQRQFSSKVEELQLGIKASKLTDSSLIIGDILPILIFLPVIIFSAIVFWKMVPLVRADYHRRLALNLASSKALDTYDNLVKAERLNPRADLYRLDLAQTNFALANAIVASKNTNQGSVSASLTDEEKKNVQQLLKQSIDEARLAVALNPLNSQNHEVLASIYRQISGVAQNSLSFSLDAYGRAIQRDPYNPLLRLSVGGIYYSAKNYDLAVRFFTDSVNLKPDFANGYYNLSVALKDKGDLRSAVAAGERVVAILQKNPDNPDYKLASEYLANLRIELENSSTNEPQVAGETKIIPPAAKQQSILEKKDLPKVVDLGEEPKASTPEAVKKPNH